MTVLTDRNSNENPIFSDYPPNTVFLDEKPYSKKYNFKKSTF